jgi:hypothetical protein
VNGSVGRPGRHDFQYAEKIISFYTPKKHAALFPPRPRPGTAVAHREVIRKEKFQKRFQYKENGHVEQDHELRA